MSENTLIIQNINTDAKLDDIYNHFIIFGNIKNVYKKVNINNNPYYFVEFEDINDMDHAIDNFDGSEFKGTIIKLDKSKSLNLTDNLEKYNKGVWNIES